MEGVVTLLTEARDTGMAVWAEADALVIRGPRSCAVLAQQLLAQKPAVLAALAAETHIQEAIAWRVTAMRPQVPERGPIPVLIARETVSAKGTCISCGEPLPRGATVRCWLCARAAYQVLHEMREGVRRVS